MSSQPLNAAVTQRLVHFAQLVHAKPWGQKGSIYAEASAELRMGRATVIRKIKELSVGTSRRKRRSDAGKTALTRDEALLISAMLLEHMRKNNKRLKSVDAAVEDLRVNGLIRAERIDSNGEIFRLSTTTISNALRTYMLHPDQLLAPEPAVHLASRHPNHVWQIDASRSVLFYLPATEKDSGLRTMDHTEFYKNKPANLVRVVQESLWRYVVTDHASGALFVWYVTGGETGGNLAEAFIQAMHPRLGNPFHGVTVMVMLDPGGANTSPPFLNLCKTLGVHVQINKPKNPRAKGQVENGQNLTERGLEATFKLLKLETLEQINEVAQQWCLWFNATQVHRRHGMTRFEAFMRIQPEQMVLAPGIELCRELAVSAPVERTVNVFLEVEFNAQVWDVSTVPNVLVNQKLLIVRNAWRPDGAQAIGVNEQGREVFYPLERKVTSDLGFAVDAAIFGETYRRHADTPAQKNLKEIEQLATGTNSLAAAEAARRAQNKGRGPVPFGGRVDPLKRMNDVQLPSYLPRKGTTLVIDHPMAQAAATERPTHVPIIQAIAQIASALERPINRDENRFIKARYVNGITPAELSALIERFQHPDQPAPNPQDVPPLRAVGGGA